MRRKLGWDLAEVAGLATLGALAAVGAFAILTALARPAGIEPSLQTITRAASIWDQALAAPRTGATVGEGALCERADQAAAIAVDQQVQDAGQMEGLALGDVTVASSGERAGPLGVLTLKLHASGAPEMVNGFLERMAVIQPIILVDIADLRTTGAGVELDLSGRVLCNPS